MSSVPRKLSISISRFLQIVFRDTLLHFIGTFCNLPKSSLFLLIYTLYFVDIARCLQIFSFFFFYKIAVWFGIFFSWPFHTFFPDLYYFFLLYDFGFGLFCFLRPCVCIIMLFKLSLSHSYNLSSYIVIGIYPKDHSNFCIYIYSKNLKIYFFFSDLLDIQGVVHFPFIDFS